MRKLLVALALILATLAHAAPARASYGDELVMPWRFYRRLAMCETGANFQHSTRFYTGGYGINRHTAWRWSGHSDLRSLSPIAQARVVDRIAWLGWTDKTGRYWWPAGPYGWGTIRANCAGLRGFICRSKHPNVIRWRREC